MQPFTDEQVNFITKLIDDHVATHYSDKLNHATDKPSKQPVNYHTLPEIRSIISDNINTLIAEFGYAKPFEIGAFRHVFSKLTHLRPGDYELNGDGIDAQPRWEAQINIALCQKWPGFFVNPFERVTPRRGVYQIKQALRDAHGYSVVIQEPLLND